MFFTRAGRASVTSVLNSGEEGDPTAVPLRHLNAKTFQMPFCLSLTDCEKVVVYAGDDIYAKNITALNHILIKCTQMLMGCWTAAYTKSRIKDMYSYSGDDSCKLYMMCGRVFKCAIANS